MATDEHTNNLPALSAAAHDALRQLYTATRQTMRAHPEIPTRDILDHVKVATIAVEGERAAEGDGS